MLEEPNIQEFDDIIHFFAVIGFEGKVPPLPTAFIRGINGECGRDVQAVCAAMIDYYFQKFKPWCRKSIQKHGEEEMKSRFLKLHEEGILDYCYEERLGGKTAMILIIWNGEEYKDYRDLSDLIDESFIIGAE
jgi:hypothetical protein